MASTKEYLDFILEQISLLVDDVENREFLCELFDELYEELSVPKKRH